jgi:hypothetical protein
LEIEEEEKRKWEEFLNKGEVDFEIRNFDGKGRGVVVSLIVLKIVIQYFYSNKFIQIILMNYNFV